MSRPTYTTVDWPNTIEELEISPPVRATENCGSCGQVCRGVANGGATCVDGECQPSWSQCFERTASLSSCAAYCESIGEQCAPAACGPRDLTARGFSGSVTGRMECANLEEVVASHRDPGECSNALDNGHVFRCCCSDGAGGASNQIGSAPTTLH